MEKEVIEVKAYRLILTSEESDALDDCIANADVRNQRNIDFKNEFRNIQWKK